MEDFVVLKKINYIYIALNQNKFVLSNLPIAVNLSKYKKISCFLFKSKKVLYGSFYNNK